MYFLRVVRLLSINNLEDGGTDLGPDVAQTSIGLQTLDDQVLKFV